MKSLFLILMFCSSLLTAKIYKGGEYRTKASYLYGRFEVRMKAAQREGMLSSFFTYNDMVPFNSAQWNEIDIEILGRYSDDIQYNTITPGQTNHVGRRQTSFNPSLEFHTYAFEWTPEYVAWFIDGDEVYRQTGEHIQTLVHAQKIMMNIWIQSVLLQNWSGQWSENSLPAFAYYDFVSYSSYTPGAGNIGTGNNFTFDWKDDFDVFDSARWDRASHTFGDNQCDFIPENIVFKDGLMILCLTKEALPGYVDNIPPNVLSARAEADGIVIYFSEEVDSSSSVIPSNYLVQNNTVTQAKILSDQKTVRLTVSGYDPATLTNVIILNIKDRFVPQNTSTGKSIAIQKPDRLTFPLKINCGGPVVAGFLADQMWNNNLEYGYLDGRHFENTNTTNGATDPVIFKTELNGSAEYRIRMPNGTYFVSLLMSENYFTAAGKRIFDIAVQGIAVEKNLDIFAKVGKGVQYQKIIPNAIVSEGMLDIHLMSLVDYAVLNGISIIQLSTGINEKGENVPGEWRIGQNYPNPFNGSTVIPFSIAHDDNVTVQFFDSLGRLVNEQFLGMMQRGDHTFAWDAKNRRGGTLSSGAYFYVVTSGKNTSMKKMVFIQ